MQITITLDPVIGSVIDPETHQPIHQLVYNTGDAYGTLPTPILNQYYEMAFYFVGWYLSTDADMERIESTTIVPNSNATIKAFYGEKMIAISFDSNGGFALPPEQRSLIYEYNKTYKSQHTTTQSSVVTQWGLPPKKMHENSGGAILSNILEQWGGYQELSWGNVSGTDYGDEFGTYWGGETASLAKVYPASVAFAGWATARKPGDRGYRIVNPDNVLDLYRSCTLYAQWDFSKIISPIRFVDLDSGYSELRYYPLYYGKKFGYLPPSPTSVSGRVFTGWYTLPPGKSAKQYIDELTGNENEMTAQDNAYPVGGVRVDVDDSYAYNATGSDLRYDLIASASGDILLARDMGWAIGFWMHKLSVDIGCNKYITLFAHYSTSPLYLRLVNDPYGEDLDNCTFVQVTPYSPLPSVTPPASPISGYVFDGYYASSGGVGNKYINADGSSTGLAWRSESTGNLFAYFVQRRYKITLHDYTPSTYTPNDIVVDETPDGKYPQMPSAHVLDGLNKYSFLNWAYVSYNNPSPVHPGDEYGFSEDTSCESMWDFKFNRINFVLNGGVFDADYYPITSRRTHIIWTMNLQIYFYRTTTSTSHDGYWSTSGLTNEPTVYLYPSGSTTGKFRKEGYTFAGWYYDSEFTVPVTSLVGVTTGDCRLYAKWTANSIVITFNYADGSTSPTTKTIYADEEIGVLPTAPGREGYVFEGWWTQSSGGKRISEAYKFRSATTVYAHWKQSGTAGMWECDVD